MLNRLKQPSKLSARQRSRWDLNDSDDETIIIKVNNVARTKRARLRLVTDNEASSEAEAKRNDLIASTISLQNNLLRSHY